MLSHIFRKTFLNMSSGITFPRVYVFWVFKGARAVLVTFQDHLGRLSSTSARAKNRRAKSYPLQRILVLQGLNVFQLLRERL